MKPRRPAVVQHRLFYLYSFLFSSFSDYCKLISTTVLENGSNKPHMVRHWLSPVGASTVEYEIKIKGFTDPTDHASYKPVRASRVAKLIDDSRILYMAKESRFLHGTIPVPRPIRNPDCQQEPSNRQRNCSR